MEVMRAAAEAEAAGRDVIHLEVGQPSTGAPEAVVAAAQRALVDDRLGYVDPRGIEPLRERIARWYDERHGVAVDPGRVMVTTGASGSCMLAFLSCFDPGDRVAVLEPGYPCYRNDLQTFGIEVVGVPVGLGDGFRPTVAHLEAAGSLDGLVLASPSNPTGTVLRSDELEPILTWARANGVRVIVDEIYHGITYDGPAVSALELDPDAIVFNSFSKYFSMTGWRLGWIVAPAELTEPLENLGANLTISAPTLSQIAAVTAFDSVDVADRNVERYRANRAVLLDGLPTAGLNRIAPADGAFYLYVATDHVGDSSVDVARRWLDELAIACTPGTDFDPVHGVDFVRLSYAGTTDEMQRACERLAGWNA